MNSVNRSSVIIDKIQVILCNLYKNKNIEKIDKIIWQNRRLSFRAVAEMVNIDKENLYTILVENLSMKKVCTKMVPKI